MLTGVWVYVCARLRLRVNGSVCACREVYASVGRMCRWRLVKNVSNTHHHFSHFLPLLLARHGGGETGSPQQGSVTPPCTSQ